MQRGRGETKESGTGSVVGTFRMYLSEVFLPFLLWTLLYGVRHDHDHDAGPKRREESQGQGKTQVRRVQTRPSQRQPAPARVARIESGWTLKY